MFAPLAGSHELTIPDAALGSSACVEYLCDRGRTLRLSIDQGAGALRIQMGRTGSWDYETNMILPTLHSNGAMVLRIYFENNAIIFNSVGITLGRVPRFFAQDAIASVRTSDGVHIRLRRDISGVHIKAFQFHPESNSSDSQTNLGAFGSSQEVIDGVHEGISLDKGVVGWAIRPHATQNVLRINVISCGVLLAHSFTLNERTDLHSYGLYSNRAGFEVGWHRFKPNQVHELAHKHPEAPVVVSVETSSEFLKSSLPVSCLSHLSKVLSMAVAPLMPSEPVAAYERISDAAVFDRDWYARSYDSIEDPLLNYLTYGEAAGRQPCLYLEPWRVAAALGLGTLEGALLAYLDQPRRVAVPGLHFHQAWYETRFLEPSKISPLKELVAARSPSSPNPFCDIESYVAEQGGFPSGENPYEHFLKNGTTSPLDKNSRKSKFANSDFIQTLRRRTSIPIHHRIQSNARVSVVVPNYNYARYLLPRLESIFAQTCPLLEVIVLDDASTDCSVELIDDLASHFGWPIKIVQNLRGSGNVFRQWKAGLDMAEGEFLWIAEADDIASPNFIDRLLRELEGDASTLFAFCDPQVIDGTGRIVADNNQPYYAAMGSQILNNSRSFTGQEALDQLLSPRNLILNASSVLWRRKVLARAFAAVGEEAFALTCAGDWRLYIEACRYGGVIRYVAEGLSKHRRHYHSVTANLRREKHIQEIEFIHKAVLPNMTDQHAAKIDMAAYRRALEKLWLLQVDDHHTDAV